MKKNIDKKSSAAIDRFLIASNTGHIKKTETTLANGETFGGTEIELFAHSDDRKRVIAYLKERGLDPFKHGTKEPAKIETVLSSFAHWDIIKELSPEVAGVKSFADYF